MSRLIAGEPVQEVSTELEYLRWFYKNHQSPSQQDHIELNNKFAIEFKKNPPELYEVKDADGNIVTE